MKKNNWLQWGGQVWSPWSGSLGRQALVQHHWSLRSLWAFHVSLCKLCKHLLALFLSGVMMAVLVAHLNTDKFQSISFKPSYLIGSQYPVIRYRCLSCLKQAGHRRPFEKILKIYWHRVIVSRPKMCLQTWRRRGFKSHLECHAP